MENRNDKKYKIVFLKNAIDLKKRPELIREMHDLDKKFLPDEHWVEAEKKLLDFINTGGNFFSNGQFEDKSRLGFNKKLLAEVDSLKIGKAYQNSDFLPFVRAIDNLNKIVSVLSLINWDAIHGNKIRILEVGGGYGRTALFFLNYFKQNITYINVDAVPSSILISEQFLSKNCDRSLKIGGYNDIQKAKNKWNINVDKFNYLSLPVWYQDFLPDKYFDVIINIWSMQEMNRLHEKFYYALWNRVAKKDTLLYFLNKNKRKFQDGYNFPPEWFYLYHGFEPSIKDPERMFILNPSSYIGPKQSHSLFKGNFQKLISFLSKRLKKSLQLKKANLFHFLNKKNIQWMNDSQVTRFLTPRPKYSFIDALQYYIKNNKNRSLLFTIYFMGKHIGNCGLFEINTDKPQLRFMIGEKSLWKKGLGTLIVKQLIFMAKKNKIKNLYLDVDPKNIAALAIYKKIGFKFEKRIKLSDNRIQNKMSIHLNEQ